MFRKLMFALVLILPLPAVSLAADRLPPPAEWIPQDVVLVAEVSQPKVLLDLATSDKAIQAIEALPAWQKVSTRPQFLQMRAVVGYLQGSLGTDWRTGLHKLLDGGVTLAANAKGASLLIVDAEDEKMLHKLHDIVAGFAKGEAAKQGNADRVKSTDYEGVACWTFSENDFHALIGNRLILANRSEMLKAALDLKAGKGKASLASLPAYQKARKAVGEGCVAAALANFGLVRQNPQVQAALSANQNPMGALLFAGLIDVLRDTNWLSLGLEVKGDTLTLNAAADGKADPKSGLAAFTWPGEAGKGALPGPAVPRRIASMSFYRDLHGFYAAKDKLFPERTSGLILFENMMGIFFSGRDLTEEVLGELGPEVRFVVAGQQYDPAIGTPHVQLPAFAAVFTMKDPKKFGEVAEEAFQKAVGLVSFTSGQKGQPGLLIDRPTHNGVKYSVAYYSAAAIENKTQVPMQYNFRPSLAKVGQYLVFSSADSLTKDLIDTLKKQDAEPPKPLADTHTAIELDIGQLGAILGANREHLVRQNMVEKGHSQKEAEGAIDVLLAIVKQFNRVKVTLGNRAEQAQAALEVKLNLPGIGE